MWCRSTSGSRTSRTPSRASVRRAARPTSAHALTKQAAVELVVRALDFLECDIELRTYTCAVLL